MGVISCHIIRLDYSHIPEKYNFTMLIGVMIINEGRIISCLCTITVNDHKTESHLLLFKGYLYCLAQSSNNIVGFTPNDSM